MLYFLFFIWLLCQLPRFGPPLIIICILYSQFLKTDLLPPLIITILLHPRIKFPPIYYEPDDLACIICEFTEKKTVWYFFHFPFNFAGKFSKEMFQPSSICCYRLFYIILNYSTFIQEDILRMSFEIQIFKEFPVNLHQLWHIADTFLNNSHFMNKLTMCTVITSQ